MDATGAALMAREYFLGVSGVHVDMGFETLDISRFDFKEWEVRCRVFSVISSQMVEFRVVISGDQVISVVRGGRSD